MDKKYINAEVLKNNMHKCTWVHDMKCVEKFVDMLPAADIAPRWIPVTERLPEEDKEVLISYRYKEGEGDTSHVNIDITTYGTMYIGLTKIKDWRPPFEYFLLNYEVIAWMPLPEPYKGGDEE